MKTKLLITIICACFLFKVQAQEWGYDNVFESESINNIWTQGLDTVYVVGINLIAKSTDRGQTWNKQYIDTSMPNPMIPKPNLTDIIFCDQNNGFIIGDRGLILKTIDGGETWKKKESGTLQYFIAIAYTSLDNIWVVSDGGIILHSIDLGETWTSVKIDSDYYAFNSIAFRDNIGCITGGYPAVLYKTEDKGQTWNKQLTDNWYNSSFYSLCLTTNKIYMCHYSSYPVNYSYSLYQSQDYLNWGKTTMNRSTYGANISFLNDVVGYSFCVESQGAIYNPRSIIRFFKTEDEGDNWIPVEVDYGPAGYFNTGRVYPSNNKDIIQLVNDTVGYAVSGGVLLRTPSPDYRYWVHIRELRSSDSSVLLYNNNSDLLIKSQELPILSVQIIDVSGKVLDTQKWNTIENEKSINILAIPKGLYLVKTILSDNTICINKWIKN